MDRTKESVAFLDTHILVWLWADPHKKISNKARLIMNNSALFISSIVLLELQYLHEIGRLRVHPEIMFSHFHVSIGLQKSSAVLSDVVQVAKELTWTRDAFDRIIVAEAHMLGAFLISADTTIKKTTNVPYGKIVTAQFW